MVIEALYPVFDSIFLPITTLPYFLSVLLISAFLTFLVLSINRLLVNKNIAKELKNKMEEIKEGLNQAHKRGDKDHANKLLDEMMKANGEYMKHTFKALIVSMIVISLFLPWVGQKYKGLAVATLPFDLPLVGHSLEWMYWYILVSLTLGWVVNKLIGVGT